MPSHDENMRQVRAHFWRAYEESAGLEEGARQRAIRDALEDATRHLATSEIARLLGEVKETQERERLRADRANQALEALASAIADEGVGTAGELMQRWGIRTLPELLAALGFDDLSPPFPGTDTPGPTKPPVR